MLRYSCHCSFNCPLRLLLLQLSRHGDGNESQSLNWRRGSLGGVSAGEMKPGLKMRTNIIRISSTWKVNRPEYSLVVSITMLSLYRARTGRKLCIDTSIFNLNKMLSRYVVGYL
jgi:hypothetical protein